MIYVIIIPEFSIIFEYQDIRHLQIQQNEIKELWVGFIALNYIYWLIIWVK